MSHLLRARKSGLGGESGVTRAVLWVLVCLLTLGAGLRTAFARGPGDDAQGAAAAGSGALDACNVVWTSRSGDASGSMPIGNGTLGANVWVDEAGDLVFYLSRIDSWSETDRLLKLGRVRVHLEPSPFAGETFRQELVLREGRIAISGGEPGAGGTLSVYVDAGTPSVRVAGTFDRPTSITASLENWRTEKKTFENDDELRSSWTMHSAPAEVRRDLVWESADVFEPDFTSVGDGIVWYHRNEHSVVPFTLERQGLGAIKGQFADPLMHRTFGGRMSGVGLVPAPAKSGVLISTQPRTELALRITTHCAQAESVHAWIGGLWDADTAASRGTPEATREWWGSFWDRSWIYVEGDGAVVKSTRAVPKNEHPLRIGADSNGENVFRGEIRTLQVYRRPLEAAEVARALPILLGVHPGVETGAVEWFCVSTGDDGGGELYADVPMTLVGDLSGASADPDDAFLRFRGGHAEVPSGQLPALASGLTFVANVRVDPSCGPARIFDKMTAGGSDGFIFDTHPGDSLRLIVGDLTLHAPGVLKKGEWQSVAATYDSISGHAALYLDGKLIKESGPRWIDSPPASGVTRAYALQRYMQACGGGARDGSSAYPIKFNGSIFTVDPIFTEGQKHNADWRKWGGCFWWQNTRLPYYPMLAAGDFDFMDPLFRLYENSLACSKARTKIYYDCDGVYFPETMTSFGSYGNGDYGWKRDGLAPGDISPCPWWQWAWNQSLELTQLMLDRAAYSGDDTFLAERALPMARETLLYFDTRFKRDDKGKLLITPTQAVETYWHEVVNDAPVVGGLHAVCDQLLALPPSFGSREDRALWRRVKDATPALPVWEVKGKDGQARKAAAPAEKFKDQRSNCETAELYPLFPFRLYGLGKPGLELAVNAYNARVDKSTVGWTQDGIFAALLGLTDEAKSNLLAKVSNTNEKHRFPAMWGPNFDWLPDQDHGGNLMNGLQLMLMQCDTPRADGTGGTIRLLPAWPKDWDVSFKLHAPGRTTVECEYRGGKVVKLVVTPEGRAKDVVMPPAQ
jgi:hypothetical protein